MNVSLKKIVFMKYYRIILFMFLAFLYSNFLLAVTLPFGFIPNKGQLIYDNGELADDVLYYNNFGQINVLFKKDRITYLIERKDPDFIKHFRYLADHDKDSAKLFELSHHAYYYRMDMIFENTSSDVVTFSAEPGSHYFNFYHAHCSDGIHKVNAYKKLNYKNVWDNIDLIFYAKEGYIKYDIILHPGADPSHISFFYEGADAIKIKNQKLHIHTPVLSWQEHIPYSFQIERDQSESAVNISYKIMDKRVSFELPEDYDPTKTLVIDPAMSWSTYFNFQQDAIWDTDAHGYGDRVIYYTRTNDNTISVTQAGAGAYLQTSMAGSRDLVFIMFDSHGVLQWATFYGGSGAEYCKGGVRIAPSGQIYVVAMSMSSDFPTQHLAGAFNEPNKLGYWEDLVIMRFDNNGVREWSTFVQMDYYASNAGLDIGPNGHLFIAGYFGLSYEFAASVPMVNPGGGAYFQSTKSVNPESSFDDESFILEFNTSGALVWSTYFGSIGPERLYKIRVAPNGTIFLLGLAHARQVIGGGTVYYPKLQSAGQYYDNTISTSNPAKLYMVKFNANRSFAWASLYGGTNGSMNPGGNKLNICIDSQSNVYFVAGTRATNFPLYNPGPPAYFRSGFLGDPSWDSNMYIIKFANNTQRLWATFFGGSGWHSRPGCAVCSNDHLFVTSATNATDHPVLYQQGSYYQPTKAGNKDGHIAEFSPQGELLWSTYVGGTYSDEELNHLVALDGVCGRQIFAFGRTGGTIGPPCVSSWPIVDPGGGAHIQTFPCEAYYQVAISRFEDAPLSGTPGIWTWTGAINNDWFEPCNWDKLSVPVSTSPVVIPGAPANQPLIANGNAHCLNIEIQSSAGALLEIDTSTGNLEVHQ